MGRVLGHLGAKEVVVGPLGFVIENVVAGANPQELRLGLGAAVVFFFLVRR